MPSCSIPSAFILRVIGDGPSYKWLQDNCQGCDDTPLVYTTDEQEATVFGLTPLNPSDPNEGTFTIIDYLLHTVQLYSSQPPENAGNEPVFFATSAYLNGQSFIPVIAKINPDCSVSLSLVTDDTDGANVLAECKDVLYLLTEENAVASGCSLVTLQLEPPPPCLDGLFQCPPSTLLAAHVGLDILGLNICVDLAVDSNNCGRCGLAVSIPFI
jgi:hypothetical protein